MDGKPNYEIPTEMREFAEKSVDQARKAFDGFLGAARRTADSFQGSATSVQSTAQNASARSFDFAEQNIAAAFDLAQKLVRSRDVQEAMQHQAEFMRSQFAAMQTQAKEFGSYAQGAMQKSADAARQATDTATSAARDAARDATS